MVGCPAGVLKLLPLPELMSLTMKVWVWSVVSTTPSLTQSS